MSGFEFREMAPDPAEGTVARAGAPLADGAKPATQETITDALRTVYDPEIPVNIYELGLIYDMKMADDGSVALTMTLTTPGCPVAGILPQQVAEAAAKVEGVGEVEVKLVWEPPWSMERMSEEARLALDMY